MTTGFAFIDHQQDAAAKRQFETAIPLAQIEKDQAAEADAHRGLGLVLMHAAQYEAARAQFEQSLVQSQAAGYAAGIASAHQELGTLAYYLGDMKNMRWYWNQALHEYAALGDRRHQEDVLYNLGFDPALTDVERELLIRKGLALAQQDHDKDDEAMFLTHLGSLRAQQGDYAPALQAFEEARVRYDEAGDRIEFARVLNSEGVLYNKHGLHARALELDQQALKIQQAIRDQEGVIQSTNAIAESYSLMGEDRKALREYEQAFALANLTKSPRLIAFIRGNMVGEQMNLGQDALAAQSLAELVSQKQDPTLLAIRYGQLSEADTHLGRFQAALDAADKALQLQTNHSDAEHEVGTLYFRARAESGLGQVQNALADINTSLSMLEHIRSGLVPGDSMKLQFGDLYRYIYDYGIELHFQNGHVKQALEIAEQGQARAFVDLLSSRRIALRPAEQATFIAMRRSVKYSQSAGSNDLTSRGDPAGNAAMEKLAGIETLPSYVSMKALPVAQVTSVAARLHTTLLSYWVTQDYTYIWVINPAGDLHAIRVAVSREHLADLIAQAWAGNTVTQPSSVATVNPAQPAPAPTTDPTTRPELLARGGQMLMSDTAQHQAWQALYHLLILPIRAALPTRTGSLLTVIPNGPLFGLSFAALEDASGHYLVERYALDYVPSVAALRYTESEARQMAGRPGHFLLVADPRELPSLPDGQILPALPGSRAEVKAIRELLPAGEATVLTGAQAREDAVEQQAREASVIHFATHAIVLPDDPLDSFIALGRGSGKSSEDGRLTAEKIYGLNLQARLIFLSACRSARGQITEDGIVGLTRAFFYAGTPTVVASLWDVADKPTSLLVADFYAAYLHQNSASRALRKAQLQMLHALRAGKIQVNTSAGPKTLPENPVFWASFIVMGNP